MLRNDSNTTAGVALAVVATLSWALNFVAPYVTGAYSIYDLMIVRFLIAGTLGMGVMVFYRARLRRLSREQQLLGASLGIIGYLGYSTCIAAGVIYGGPVLTPALIGMVPLLQAVLGNATSRTLEWRKLVIPLALMTGGLLLLNVGSLNHLPTGDSAWRKGLFFSISAVILWLVFAALNQRGLEKLAVNASGAWTGLMMAGAGLGTLIALPAVLVLDLLKLPSLGFSVSVAGPLYAWGLFIALMSSVVGAWAWNAASRRLPMVLSGQLISLESLFATILGLMFHQRLPTLWETSGLAGVLVGVVVAVRIILTSSESTDRARHEENIARRTR
ncbi:EamA/RhaT family transporter [Pseudomonas sp. Fig-3]|jgi:drug/metabolite transporter (DMT)-like permease|uniref:Amino acid transporter n=1 Tax=Pseudomonas rhizophila TaxID=2045200 RepID=A0ABM6UIX3_9PSED|nr:MULTISPECIES: EamA family transporter [Pseudomonas]AVU77507.1 amino acid transporter [Pseudomonas rhizophila]MBD0701518.1 amino acid transporter [Pseudomonas sp. PSB1]QKJ35688.1 EamA family transporter [Pseudomonas sp. MPDS]TNB83074.1 EamA/RhaT family transporter [Pseudomonas sp. Fig-3]WNZ76171.1 EamA family transporter [Pseudomonas sp. P105]